MERRLQLIALAIGGTLLSGCASSLKTFDAQKNPSVGIPVGTPILVKITERTTYEVDPKHPEFQSYCKTDVNATYEFLPLGERSYIAFEPAALGKGEFKVEFNDNGALKTVSVNSDATAGTQSVTELLSTILPYMAAPKPTPEIKATIAKDTAQETKEKYCIKKGTEVTDVERVNIK